MNAKQMILAIVALLPGHLVSLVMVDGVLAAHIVKPGHAPFGAFRFDEGDEERPPGDVAADIVALYNSMARLVRTVSEQAPS